MTVGVTTHLKINTHEYMVKPFSYVKRQAPQFGARFTTGDPDFNNLSIWQHWGQRCFIGGVGQEEFQDDAMYDEGVGVDTSEHEKVTVTRDLARGTGSNWAWATGTSNGDLGNKFIVYNNVLYVLTIPSIGSEGHLYSYSKGTDGWTRVTSLDAADIQPRSIATHDGKLFIGGTVVSSSTSKLVWSSGSLTSWNNITNPSGVSGAIYAMRAFQRKLYVAFKTRVWRLKEDQTWDGNTVFYKADQNSDSNYMVSMETHLGFLYMLSQNGHVHRTDGNSTFDIWSWDGQTYGAAIKSFDGRLFILTFEFTETADVGFGCLYQMSGSAVTMLKRWGDEGQATNIGNMTVYDRKLYYGASNLLGFGARPGFGVAVYDPIEDAHSIFCSNADTVTWARGSSPYRNYIVDDQMFFGGQLFVAVRGHGGFRTPHQPRDRALGFRRFDFSAAGGSVASKNGGWFTTSTYDAGTPGVRKLWRKLVIDYRLPSANNSIFSEYSTDDGVSWTTLAGLTTTNGVTNQRSKFEYWLPTSTQSVSLKLRFTLRTTSNLTSPWFHGFVVSYIPIPEPNWMWNFTIVLAETITGVDGQPLTFDTEAEMAYLETLHRTRALVTFQDVDGKIWASNGAGALIYDIEFRIGQMTQPLEGEVLVTLIEAVETY